MGDEASWLQAADVALLLAIVAFLVQKAIRIRRETSFGRALAVWNGTLALAFLWTVIRRWAPEPAGLIVAMGLRGLIVAALVWGEREFRRLDHEECDAVCREQRRRVT